MRRRKGLPVVSLETIGELGAAQRGADELLEVRETRDRVSAAIATLPEHQRLVVSMFYIGELSHSQVATFLGVPVQTVKNRLHAARRRMEKELIDMARKKLQKKRPSRTAQFAVHVMDELTEISDLGIQRLLRQVDQKDCVVALKGASPAVREKVMGNMSQRVRTFIEEEMEALGEIPEEEIRRAQQLMVDLLRQFHYRSVKLDKEHRDRKRRIKQLLSSKPFAQMTFDELTDFFMDLSKISSHEGPLAVEEFADAIPEERADTDRDALLFVSGLRRGIMGSGRELIAEILEKRMRQILQEHETRCRIIIDGVASLADRAAPDHMRTRLRAYYTVDGY